MTTSTAAKEAGRWLRWSLGALDHPVAPPPMPSVQIPSDLAERAEFHGISPLVHLALRRQPGVPAAVASTLASSYHHAVQRHLTTLDDLRVVDAGLGDLPWLVLKGPVLSEAVYARADWRSYADLDVVVPAHRLADAVHRLEQVGCRLEERDWHIVLGRVAGEVHLRLPSGSELDLHWHLLNDQAVRQRFSLSMTAVFARARLVTLGGRPYRTLGSADTLVHLALHACLAGANRLVWLKDVEQAVRGDDLDWDDVCSTAAAWGGVPAVAAQLERCRRMVDLRLPPGAAPIVGRFRTWAQITGLADRFAPPEAATGQPSAGRLVWRSTAATTQASLTSAVRKSWLRATESSRLRTTPIVARGDDEAARRAYFSLVEHQGR